MEILDTTKLSDELWQKYYDFTNALNLKYYKDKKLDSSTWSEFKDKKSKKTENLQFEEYNEFILLNENKIVGWFDKVVTPINILFGFDTIFENLSEEFVKCLLKEIYNFMIEKNKSEAFWWSFDERKLKQILELNVEKFEDYMIYSLEKENADVKLFKSWIETVERKFNYTVKVYENSSDFDFDKYAEFVKKILTEISLITPLLKNKNIEITNNDVKNMISINERSDFLCCYYILFNESNNIIGLSNVIINKLDPQRVHYDGGLTAVHKNYRGNGFGRYLKAKMFFHLAEKYPDFKMITTDTMPVNKNMYRINEEFGFKPYKKGAKFRFTKEFLENYLNKNK